MHKFFIFELALLHYPSKISYEDRLNNIISYCIVEYGKFLEIPDNKYLNKLKKSENKFIDTYAIDDETLNRILLSREDLGITGGSLDNNITRHKEANKIIKSFKYNIPKVAIHKSLFFDIRDKHVLSENEFKCLCSIYSILGSGTFKLIRLEAIKRRYEGYFSKEHYYKSKQPGLITTKKINRIIERLYQRKFFYRITINSRFTYYGYCNKFEDENQFIEKIKDKLNYRFSNKPKNIKINFNLTDFKENDNILTLNVKNG